MSHGRYNDWKYRYRSHKDPNEYDTHGRKYSSSAPGRSSLGGTARRNGPPKPHAGYNPNGVRYGFGDGPQPATPATPTPGTGTPATPATPSSNVPSWAQAGYNLENDLPFAQGNHSPWAQPTSLSSTINSLLMQANSDANDFWKVWGMDKGPGLQQAMNNSMGAFGVNTIYNSLHPTTPNGGTPAPVPPGTTPPATDDKSKKRRDEHDRDFKDRYDGENRYRRYTGYDHDGASSRNAMFSRLQNGGSSGTNRYNDPNAGLADPSAPMQQQQQETSGSSKYNGSSKSRDRDDDKRSGSGKGSNNPTSGKDVLDANPVYNPWSKGQGGDYNRHGPIPQQMLQPTMEALSLANAYFAPQRMELAYQLGDMETDMRRLAVNLGRQVDDPVLQAKLYKEGQRAVRTLDVQQNTFAFQMAEQRRREETQNFQFYDNLAQNEHKLMLANQQFYDDLELRSMQLEMSNQQFNASLDLQNYQTSLSNRQFYDNLDIQRRYYNLQNWQVANAANPLGGSGSGSTPPPENAPTGGQQQEQESLSGLFNAMFR